MKYLVLTLFLTVTALTHAESDLAMKTLNQYLSGMVEVKSDSIIEFCPTHKCDTFYIDKPHSDFSNYVFLHLYHNNEYLTIEDQVVYKEQRFQKNTAPEEAEIRSLSAHYCKNKVSSPQCILSGMRSALGIKVCWSNYDEGNYCVVCDGKTTCEKL